MSCSISLKVPHKVRMELNQGTLIDPPNTYGEFAYWHNEKGWYASPLPGVEYVEWQGIAADLAAKNDQ